MTPNIATLTLNPAIDQTASIPNFSPGEVNRVVWEQADPGGKGINVASFLADFGHQVAVTGFLGADNIRLFERLFSDKNIEDQFVRLPGNTRVNIKIVDDTRHQITDINFPGQTPSAADIGSVKRQLEQLVARYDWFVLAGSIPAGIPTGFYTDLVTRLKANGKRVVLDTSGEALREAVTAGPFAIKPNVDELSELVGRRLQTPAEILDAGRDLLRRGIHLVVVSMGSQGALFIERDDQVHARSVGDIEIKSTVGAGDAMVAGIVTGKLRGLGLADRARLATAFSIGALSQIGPHLPAPDQVESFMNRVDIRTLS